ncbi:tudor domain-containing protein 1-like [Sitodiplosis mosellana]|uniref:tudor domain-containing protein 1-like n=1 Tax=Sitodiplosis mosellana TaxID=263140 RepID=UPI002444F19A|nr:tudor domain-containing protein 1-like [Sitodiplosis mosellana]
MTTKIKLLKPNQIVEIPEPGQMILAKYTEDEQLYRARIEKVENRSATVFYVDFGNEENVDINSLFEWSPTLNVLPHQAIPCNINKHEFIPTSIKCRIIDNLEKCINSNWFNAKVTNNNNNILCIDINGWYQYFNHDLCDEFWS